jgi:hypothetical protein
MKIIEENLLKLQKEVEEGLYRYRSDHYYIDYNYLSDNTKKFLRRSLRHILKLKEMLKEQEESNKTKLEEKEEEITRLKNGKEDMNVDDEIRKSFEIIVHLKTQIEEAKRIEELLKNQINEKEVSCCKLEAEIVDLRKKVDNSNKFLNSSLILDEILESQRSPYDQSGLGYKKKTTHAKASTSKKHEVSPSKKEDNVEKQPSTQGKENLTKQGRHQEAILGTPKQRYESIFHGHCYSCSGYGHKAFECRSYERRYNGRFYNTMRCWRCDQVGHIVVHYNTNICYSSSGFGHKSQECWSTRRNSMMRNSNSMARRRNEVIKGDIFENMDAQSSSSEEKAHLQKWVKKTEKSEHNERLKGSSKVSSTEAYAGDSGDNHIHTQADLE